MMDVVSLSELFGKASLPGVGSLISEEMKARFLRLTSVDSFNMVELLYYCLFIFASDRFYMRSFFKQVRLKLSTENSLTGDYIGVLNIHYSTL